MIHFLTHLFILLSAAGFYFGGVWVWTGFIFVFIIFSSVEYMTAKFEFRSENKVAWYSDLPVLMTPFVLGPFLLYTLFALNDTTEMSEFVGIIASSGVILGAFGITSAHELVHRRQRWQRGLGVFNLMLVNFAHWGLEHVYGHHKYVATPEDPASARRSETLYSHWGRNYFGGLKGAYRINSQKVLSYFSVTVVASSLVFYFFGARVLCYIPIIILKPQSLFMN